MMELNLVLIDRRNMQVLKTVLESNRASLLEKQEAELALLRRENLELRQAAEKCRIAAGQDEANAIRAIEHSNRMANLLDHAVGDVRRMNANIKELVEDYWALIDGCSEVLWETKENSRGQKRKPPAAEQLKKIQQVVNTHNQKRARQIVDAMEARAGSSTDR